MKTRSEYRKLGIKYCRTEYAKLVREEEYERHCANNSFTSMEEFKHKTMARHAMEAQAIILAVFTTIGN